MAETPETITHSFKSVSCARDPLDMRPALLALEREIAERAAKGPLVVLMGEDHTIPAHKALRQGLMARLLKSSSPFAYGMERAHDMLGHIIEKYFDQPVSQDAREQLRVADSHGRRLARLFRAALTPENTPLSGKNLLAFCLKNKISMQANDAAKINIDGKWHLNTPQGQHIPTDTVEGISLRNQIIVERALAHMNASKSGIYVQDCGIGHMLGRQTNANIWPYEESLSAMFLKAGVDVLPVYIADYTDSLESLPAGAADVLADKGLVINDMKAQRFWVGMNAPYMERQFLEEISAHSGNEIAIFPDMTLEEYEYERKSISREIPRWLQQAGIKP